MKNFALSVETEHRINFSGSINPSEFFRVKSFVNENGITRLVGMGGGKAMDICKLVKKDMPQVELVLIPTSAATCASYTPVSVMYDKEGVYMSTMESGVPDKLIIDYNMFYGLPMGFFAAGLVDTIAKYYETVYFRKMNPQADIFDEDILANAEFIFARIINNVLNKFNAPDNALKREMTDIIIMFSGMLSCMGRYTVHASTAHVFAHALTISPGARQFLHGEHMGAALLFQEALGGNAEHLTVLEEILGGLDVPRKLSAMKVREDEMQAVFEKFRKIELDEHAGAGYDDNFVFEVLRKCF
jgi:glycerol dehydrogenase-like iron-containing ADH family enzyme